MEDVSIVNGTIISSLVKETSKGTEYKHISVMKENSQEVLELNAFDNLDLSKLEEGCSFAFTLVNNGKFTNLQEVNELPAGTQLQLTPEQVKVATDVSYKNKTAPKNSYAVGSYFTKLTKVGCETAKKGNFTYVSWAEAWAKLKSVYPNSNFDIKTNADGLPIFGNEDLGYFVKVEVIVEGISHTEIYPIVDDSNNTLKLKPYTIKKYNKEIKVDKVIDSFIINKSIKRAFAKAIALHGLGLYVFKGEDLPNTDEIEEVE